MRIEGPNFKFEAILEAPIWMLVVVLALVTAAVVIGALAL